MNTDKFAVLEEECAHLDMSGGGIDPRFCRVRRAHHRVAIGATPVVAEFDTAATAAIAYARDWANRLRGA